MNKILVTGATGFLGRYLCAALNKRRLSYATIGRSQKNTIVADLGEGNFEIKDRFDAIIHCAGKAHIVPKTETEAADFYKVNVDGTKNLLFALEKSSIKSLKSFVFISTVSVYGLIEGSNITEIHSLSAEDPYGKSKIICEELILQWCKKYEIPCLILRIPLLIGKNAPGNFGAMINGIKKGYYFNIDGGHARKSMVLATDVADFIPNVFGKSGVYNLTDGFHPSFKELSEQVGEVLQINPKNMPFVLAKTLAFSGDVFGRKFPIDSHRLKKIISSLTFNDEKARQELDWNPKPVLAEVKKLVD